MTLLAIIAILALTVYVASSYSNNSALTVKHYAIGGIVVVVLIFFVYSKIYSAEREVSQFERLEEVVGSY
jgi:hypothetical protein